MHPNTGYHCDDHALHEALIDQIGFGMIFAQTADGPRVAHATLLSTGAGAVQFHLSRGNALSKNLAGSEALILVNGPDAYISPRWYQNRDTVPTWDYTALELEGPIRQLGPDSTLAMLEAISLRHEAQIRSSQQPWRMEELSESKKRKLLAGIVSFEMAITKRRGTMKLSQNKSAEERETIATGLDELGAASLATLIRDPLSGLGDQA